MHDIVLVKPNDLLRRLNRRATKLGLGHTTVPGDGGHLKVFHDGRRTIVSMHRQDIKPGTFRAILKQLGLTEQDLEF